MDAITILRRQIRELVDRVDRGEESPFTVKVSTPEFAEISSYLSDNPTGVDHLVPTCLLFAEVTFEVVD